MLNVELPAYNTYLNQFRLIRNTTFEINLIYFKYLEKNEDKLKQDFSIKY